MAHAIGSDASYYDSMIAAVPGANAKRHYAQRLNGDGSAHMPASWPAGAGSLDIYSIYPNLNDVVSGALDTQLDELCASAPPNAALALYHEMNVPGMGYATGSPQYLYPGNYHKACHRVKQIANDHGVVLGIIGTGPVSSWSTWIPSTGSNSDQLPAGFDWYGQDTYQTYHVSTADGAPSLSAWTSYLMNPLLNLAKSQTGWAHPRIYIPETGSNFGCQGGGSSAGFGSYYAGEWHYCTRNRPQWHNMVAHWLHANCTGSRMCIFWSDGRDPTQSLNGPWSSVTKPDIDMLQSIVATAPGN
jgi:hypothetical protein